MAYTTLTELFTGIGNAIRTKKGTTSKIKAQDMPNEILSISGSGEERTSSFRYKSSASGRVFKPVNANSINHLNLTYKTNVKEN